MTGRGRPEATTVAGLVLCLFDLVWFAIGLVQRVGNDPSAYSPALIAAVLAGACLLVVLMAATPAQAAPTLPPGFQDELVTPIDRPMAVAFVPGGRILIARFPGVVRLFKNGSLDPVGTPALTISAKTCSDGERGLMSIEVEAEPRKHEWSVEVLVSAEHKHDFVARVEADTPQMAMDGCCHKVEQQLRRYKEKVQQHHGALPQGGTSPLHPDLPEPPASS